jgi:dihydroneopterin aldolase
MNRLFHTLRGIVDKPRPAPETTDDALSLSNFDSRIEVLCSYAERSAAYEDDLAANYDEVVEQLTRLQELMEASLDAGEDRDALEYLRLAVRIRPQRDLLDRELRAFHSVAAELIARVNTLMEYLDEARQYAENAALSPAATFFLDATLNRLTRYFIMLERVTRTRHRALPERLAQQITDVVDDRQLDLELATYILSRRRALSSGRTTRK